TVNQTFTIGSVLELDSPTVGISGMVVHDDGTFSAGTISIGAASATLFPGNTTFTASATNIAGTYDFQAESFSLTMDTFSLAVGEMLKVEGDNLSITYDPTNPDPHQQLISVDSATIDIPKLGLTGVFAPSQAGDPGLVVYKDGFHISSGTLTKTGTYSISSIVTFVDPSVSVSNFDVVFGPPVSVSGTIGVAFASLTLFPG